MKVWELMEKLERLDSHDEVRIGGARPKTYKDGGTKPADEALYDLAEVRREEWIATGQSEFTPRRMYAVIYVRQ